MVSCQSVLHKTEEVTTQQSCESDNFSFAIDDKTLDLNCIKNGCNGIREHLGSTIQEAVDNQTAPETTFEKFLSTVGSIDSYINQATSSVVDLVNKGIDWMTNVVSDLTGTAKDAWNETVNFFEGLFDGHSGTVPTNTDGTINCNLINNTLLNLEIRTDQLQGFLGNQDTTQTGNVIDGGDYNISGPIDGKFNNQDAKWNDLRIWQDVNGDAVTDSGELKTLDEAGIKEIDYYKTINGFAVNSFSVMGDLSKLCLLLMLIPALLTSCTSKPNKEYNKTGSITIPNSQKWKVNIVPIYDHIVVFGTPFDWSIKPVYQNFDSNYYISEFIPQNQNVNDWEEMLTVSGYKKIDLTPKSYFSSLYAASEKICGSKNTAAQIIKEEKDFLLAMLMCGGLDKSIKQSPSLKQGQGDISIYKIYKASNSLYSIFYSWRGKDYDVKAKDGAYFPATMDELKKYIVNSKKVKICDRLKPVGECVDYVKLSNQTLESFKNKKVIHGKK